MNFSCTSFVFYFQINSVDFNYFYPYVRDSVRTLTKEDDFVILQCHETIHQMKTVYYTNIYGNYSPA